MQPYLEWMQDYGFNKEIVINIKKTALMKYEQKTFERNKND